MINTFVIGAFYQSPEGKILYTYGMMNYNVTCKDEDDNPYSIPMVLFQQYKYLNIRDFPNAKDPRLPYVFDLKWDFQYLSDFMREAKDEPALMKEGQRLAKELGINLNDPQSLRDWNKAQAHEYSQP